MYFLKFQFLFNYFESFENIGGKFIEKLPTTVVPVTSILFLYVIFYVLYII